MFHYITFFSLLSLLCLFGLASPTPHSSGDVLLRRTDPVFPDQPPSCPICAKDYPSINSCAQAAPVLSNFTMIIFNPGAFIDVIKCACTETFQSVFPQCVDCFTQTGQTDVLNTPDLPSVVNGMRNICGLESSLLGNVSQADGETTPTTSSTVASTTASSGASPLKHPSLGATSSLVLLGSIISIVSLSL